MGCGPQEEFYGCSDIAIEQHGKTSTPDVCSGHRIKHEYVAKQARAPAHIPTTTPPEERQEDPGFGYNYGNSARSYGSKYGNHGSSDSSHSSANSGSSYGSEDDNHDSSNYGINSGNHGKSGRSYDSNNGNSEWSASNHGNKADEKCSSAGAYKGQAGMDNWCVTNCAAGYCPPSHCECGSSDPIVESYGPEGREAETDRRMEDPPRIYQTREINDNRNIARCYAIGPIRYQPGMNDWCQQACDLGSCPRDECKCVPQVERERTPPSDWDTHHIQPTTAINIINGDGYHPTKRDRAFDDRSRVTGNRQCNTHFHAMGHHRGDAFLDTFCFQECPLGNCLRNLCECADIPSKFSSCFAVGAFKNNVGNDQFCKIQCYSNWCPPEYCQCPGENIKK